MYCSRCGQWAPEESSTCGTCGAALQLGAEPHRVAPVATAASAAVAPAVVYAGVWRRLFALVLDNLVLWFPEAIVRVLSGLDMLGRNSDVLDPREWWASGFSFGLMLLYVSILGSSPLEGTLGQRVLGLRMTTLDGRRLSFGRALGRGVASLVSLFTCGIGYLVMLWTARRQTLHDLISGTLVVRTSDGAGRTAGLEARPVAEVR